MLESSLAAWARKGLEQAAGWLLPTPHPCSAAAPPARGRPLPNRRASAPQGGGDSTPRSTVRIRTAAHVAVPVRIQTAARVLGDPRVRSKLPSQKPPQLAESKRGWGPARRRPRCAGAGGTGPPPQRGAGLLRPAYSNNASYTPPCMVSPPLPSAAPNQSEGMPIAFTTVLSSLLCGATRSSEREFCAAPRRTYCPCLK